MRTYRFGSETSWLDKTILSYPRIRRAWEEGMGHRSMRVLYVYEHAIIRVAFDAYTDGILVGALHTDQYIQMSTDLEDYMRLLHVALQERGLEEQPLTTLSKMVLHDPYGER